MGTLIWKADPITCPERITPVYQGAAVRLSSNDLPTMIYINQPTRGGQLFVELLETKIFCRMVTVYSTGVEGIYVFDSNKAGSIPPLPHGKLDPMNIVMTRFVQAKAGFVFRKLEIMNPLPPVYVTFFTVFSCDEQLKE